MAAVISTRIKVPGKKSLEFFMSNWNQLRNPVLNGEFDIPNPGSELSIDMAKVSHGITGIKTDTFDPTTNTVVADIVFTGPKSAEAIDEYVKGDIRFLPRCVKVRPPNGTKKDVFESIVTWDLVHRPNNDLDPVLDKAKQEMRQEANAKDRYIELRKKKK